MKTKEKNISFRMLDKNKDAINDILKKQARGENVYFDVYMDISRVDKIIVSYDSEHFNLSSSFTDADFYKEYLIHNTYMRSEGLDFYDIAKVIKSQKKDGIAKFTLSIPISWEEEIVPKSVEEATSEACRIINNARSKAIAERKRILKQTEDDCLEMRRKTIKELNKRREELNNYTNRIDKFLSVLSKRDCLSKREELHEMLKFLTLYQNEEDLIIYKDEEEYRTKIKDLKDDIRWQQGKRRKDRHEFDSRVNWISSSLRPEHMDYDSWQKWGTRLADYFDDVAFLYAELRPKLGLKTSLTKIIDCYYGIDGLLEGYGLKLSKEYVSLWENLITLSSGLDSYKRQKKEEERAEKELERERIKAEKEYLKAIMQAEKDEATARRKLEEVQRELEHQKENEKKYNELKSKIQKLEIALKEAIKRGERAKSMAEQTKKGFVYIISNVNSFGQNVFKIGLTRRLDPTERVDELGNASVPFPFQIHAIIESDDAPTLEAKLHKKFHNQKINKENWRKEFFKITINDIRKALKDEGLESSVITDYSIFDYKID